MNLRLKCGNWWKIAGKSVRRQAFFPVVTLIVVTRRSGLLIVAHHNDCSALEEDFRTSLLLPNASDSIFSAFYDLVPLF
jgi:hypothetical protein